MAEARIDKWLWAARVFKTRTIAAEACKRGRVTVNSAQVKASRGVKPGDIVSVRKPPIAYQFKVLQAIENRVGAKLVPDVLQDITPKEQYEMLEMSRISGFVNRAKGMGRPTKKDRREIDNFTAPEFLGEFDWDEEDDDEEELFDDEDYTGGK